MISVNMEESIRQKYEALRGELDERGRRLWAAAEARALGHGGVAKVARATGLAESTIRQGRKELERPMTGYEKERRVRRRGAGRKKIAEHDPELLSALDSFVEPMSRGSPMSPLRWTCKSTRKLAAALTGQGHSISYKKVGALLKDMGYSLQGIRKNKEGSSHPDRDAQFQYIARYVKKFQKWNKPVISVDTKKKELVGDFANGGREYQPKGEPEKARTHDFPDKELGKVIPYGVYDMTDNAGWVSVGVDHDTAQFAVETIRRWWSQMGNKVYPDARQLLITADCGGSNGHRPRLWKYELQRLADDFGLAIRVCHFPPGTSKWNKIEHRMWSRVTENWRGRPLVSREVVVNLIANTTTQTGLRIKAALDEGNYPTKIKVTDKQVAELRIKNSRFHGDWNYMIRPRT